MKVFFERKEELAPSIWQYYFRPERPLDYVAGQYIDIQLPAVVDDPRGPSRVFTLTSLPNDELLSFVAKYELSGSNYKQVLNALEPGSEAKTGDAMGDLVLPKSPHTPLVWVAGGIGIASFVGMARWLNEHQEHRDIHLFYVLRGAQERIFDEHFTPFHTSVIVAPERLRVEQLLEGQSNQTLYYISGSQNFVEGLRNDLEAHNIPRERIAFDYYDGYTDL